MQLTFACHKSGKPADISINADTTFETVQSPSAEPQLVKYVFIC